MKKQPLIIVVKDYEQKLPQNKLRHEIGKHLGIEKKLKSLTFSDEAELDKEICKLSYVTYKEVSPKPKENFVFIDMSNEHFIETQSKSKKGIQVQMNISLHALFANYRERNNTVILYINNMTSNFFIREVNKKIDTEIFISSDGKFIYVKTPN